MKTVQVNPGTASAGGPGSSSEAPIAQRDLSPSERILAQASETYTVDDEAGRKLTIKRPGILEQMRLISIIGGENAANMVYMQFASTTIICTAVDGEAMFAPNTKTEYEANLSRLGNHGVTAVLTGVEKHFSGEAEAEAVKN